MGLTKYKLGSLLEMSEERNENLEFGIDDVKGISIQKVFIETKADMTGVRQLRGVNVDDALRFADLLSKSTHTEKADSHKIWAHEIITMLLTLYPEDEVVSYYAGSVLTSTGNFMGRRLVKSGYVEPTAMDELFSTLSDIADTSV